MTTQDSGPVRMGLLGDRVPGYAKHDLLEPAIRAAGAGGGWSLQTTWLPSERLASDLHATLEPYDALVATPQSHEYCTAPQGVKAALRYARRRGISCLAICGGAQLALEEHTEDILGEEGATDILTLASCDPGARPGGYAVEGLRSVDLVAGTDLAASLGAGETKERFACSYVLAETAERVLARHGVTVVGTTPDLGPTLFEWRDHPYYVASLFLPHWRESQPHPLFTLLLERARQQPPPGRH